MAVDKQLQCELRQEVTVTLMMQPMIPAQLQENSCQFVDAEHGRRLHRC